MRPGARAGAARRGSRALVPWLLPLALMGAIYYGSAQPDLAPTHGTLNFIARKLFHAAEYGLLGLLCRRALCRQRPWRQAALAAIAICVVYAGSDEFHQSFVRGRSGEFSDVLIDSAGAAVAIAISYWAGWPWTRVKSAPSAETNLSRGASAT